MKEGIIRIHFSHAHRLARRKEGIYEGKGRKEGMKEGRQRVSREGHIQICIYEY
jgi:hypothetical protein